MSENKSQTSPDVDPAGIMSLTEHDLAVNRQLAEAEASRQRAIEASNVDLEKRREVEREKDELRLALATAIKEGCSCDLLYGDRCFIHRLETVPGVAAVVARYRALENILILTGDFIAKAGWAPADLADAIAALSPAPADLRRGVVEWKSKVTCPIQGCEFATKYRGLMWGHLNKVHNGMDYLMPKLDALGGAKPSDPVDALAALDRADKTTDSGVTP